MMIKFENITVNFRGTNLFTNLSFEITRNSKVLIAGKSGYGKSTLFAILLGYYRLDEGKVFFDGKEVTSETAWDVRKRIAYVDQDASIGGGKVSDWFATVAALKANRETDFGKTAILRTFELLELSPQILYEETEHLSGGERQRVALATALLLKRKIFLLDEPTSALDETLKRKITDYFVNMEDVTLAVISHDEIWRSANKIDVFNMEKKEWAH